MHMWQPRACAHACMHNMYNNWQYQLNSNLKLERLHFILGSLLAIWYNAQADYNVQCLEFECSLRFVRIKDVQMKVW